MKKVLLFLLFLFLLIGNPVKAQNYATCDLCGYCDSTSGTASLPRNWEECRNCIYPIITSYPASANKTLEIQSNNTPPTPYPNRQFTILGCIISDAGNRIIQEGPASSLSEKILTALFSVAGSIAFLYFLYGAFLLITSQSEPEKLIRGKRVLYGAIVGLIFSLSAVLIIKTLAVGILKLPGISGP